MLQKAGPRKKGVPTLSFEAAPSVVPLWKMSGTGEFDVSTHVTAHGEDSGTSTTHCTGTATYKIDVLIYKDIIIDSG